MDAFFSFKSFNLTNPNAENNNIESDKTAIRSFEKKATKPPTTLAFVEAKWLIGLVIAF